jgi:hypothetical protein
MLHCGEGLAAMQTTALFWHLVYIRSIREFGVPSAPKKEKGI